MPDEPTTNRAGLRWEERHDPLVGGMRYDGYCGNADVAGVARSVTRNVWVATCIPSDDEVETTNPDAAKAEANHGPGERQRRAGARNAELRLHIGFEDIGAVHVALAASAAEKLEERFVADGVQLRVSVAEDQLDGLRTRLRDATRDRARILQ